MPLISSLGLLNAIGFGFTASATIKQYIAVSQGASPYIKTYKWNNGFSTAFANPSTLPMTFGAYATFTNLNDTLAVSDYNNTWVAIYPWSLSGYGTKYTSPGIGGAGNGGCAFSKNDNLLSLCGAAPLCVAVFPWTTGTGQGTRYANPAITPTRAASATAFNNSTSVVAYSHARTSFVTAYPWSNGFGTKYADPSTLPAGDGKGVTFNSLDDSIAIAHTTSPFVTAYPWSNGFGTKYANPSTLPTGNGTNLTFNKAGTLLAISFATSPFVAVYPWSNGFGTKYANPSTLPAGAGKGVSFSSDGSAISIAHTTSPFVTAYPWSNGFGTKYADPSSLPADVNSNAFSN